ncbi:MAG TPA: dihydroorotate dehydrogenase electron transfer subunit [Gammaproteobacteria bacterium]|nr:dihydroorotate dehydrogenase electron transfer subunit [Gammaproteobacteria bacterium]
MEHPVTRNTIFSEQAAVIEQQAMEALQFILRLDSPLAAKHARPGSFVHIQCDSELKMRRPMSVMRANPGKGWIDILYKIHGEGTERLARKKPGDIVNSLGPIGVPFKLDGYRKYPLLIGGGVGMPPMIFLAEHMKKTAADCRPFVILGSEIPFPFKAQPSRIMLGGVPEGAIASMPLLEDWGIPSRLASLQGYAGCFEGFVTDLARHWLNALDERQRGEVEVFACGPIPMLAAVSQLAHEFGLPCQVSVEEYMACAVGGCAGCTILVETEAGPAMKRVCVDGPVFEAASVFPPV